MKNINFLLLVIVVLLGSCNLFLDVVNTIEGTSTDIDDSKKNQSSLTDDGAQLTATPVITPTPTAEPTDQGIPTPSQVPTPVPTGLPTPTPSI